MNIDQLERIIKGRRSIRKWKKDQVPDDLLRRAVELATWAPNGGNFQGWHFIVIKNAHLILEMAHAVQSAVDKIASWPESGPWHKAIRRSQISASNFANAPACVAVLVTQYQSHLDKVLVAREHIDNEAKQISVYWKSAPTSIQNAAAAVTIMLLSLHCMGLGAVWLKAPLVAKEKIESILKIPENMDLICLVAVGYPDEAPYKDRKPLDQVLTFIS